MRFLYLAIHYPKPEHSEELLGAMRDLGRVLATVDGMIEASAWLEAGGERIVATSIWESAEAFQRALPVIGASVKDVPFVVWEAKPRELFRLNELP